MKTTEVNLKSYLFELVFDKEKDGVTAVSVVSSPAILTNFVKFGEDVPDVKFVLASEEQKIIAGPILIPRIKIFRSGKSLGLDQDAYVYFGEDTIRALAEDYNEKLKIHNATEEHKDPTTGIKMMENWIVEDSKIDKSALYGFSLPKGSWFGMYRVHDDELWKKIKNEDLRGFSIEAALGLVPKGEISLSEEEPEDDRIVLEKELQPLFLQRLDEVGHKEDIMRHLGFVKVSEDGNLTKEGEAIALTFAVSAEPAEKSALDDGLYAIRYKYSGPLDEKNRDFCRDVMTKDLIYRKEDIDQMSFRGENPMSKQNYSIFRYKGSYNCRHRWVKQVYFAADWEKALEDLELYLEWISEIVKSIVLYKSGDETLTKIWELLDGTYANIKKTLEDFQKQGPFGEKGPQESQITKDYPSNLPQPEFESEATEVNKRVGLSKEIKLAFEELDEAFGNFKDKMKKYSEVETMLKQAYDETKEPVFEKALNILEESVSEIMVLFKKLGLI